MPKTADEIRQEVERLLHEAVAAYAASTKRSWAEGFDRGMLHALLMISLFIDDDLPGEKPTDTPRYLDKCDRYDFGVKTDNPALYGEWAWRKL